MTRSAALDAPRMNVAGLRLVLPLLFAALMAAAGLVRVPIPGSPVPLTLQVVVVLLAGAWLRPMAAASSMLIFLAAGALGAPVYSGGGMGAAYLLGPTGGYLIGFVAGSAACAAVLRGRRDSALRTVAAMSVGVAVIHLMGAVQLAVSLGGDLVAAVRLGILPFLPVDLLKIAMAAAVTTGAAGLASRRR